MFIKLLSAVAITAALFSCGSSDEKTTPTEAAKKDSVVMPMHQDSNTTAKAALSAIKLDFEKDFVCGMHVKSGVEDTTSYKGKVYGFCSKECKEDFVKNPESFLVKK